MQDKRLGQVQDQLQEAVAKAAREKEVLDLRKKELKDRL